MENPKKELNKIHLWAKEKIDSGNEPPWAWYQYMKLIETVEAIQEGMASTKASATKENSLQLVRQQGNVLQLTGSTSQQDNSLSHQGTKNVLMPM